MTASLSTTVVDIVSILDLSKRKDWVSVPISSGLTYRCRIPVKYRRYVYSLQSTVYNLPAARFPRFRKPDVRPMLHDNKQKRNSQPSGRYIYRTVVTICTAQWLLYVPPV